MMMMNEEAEAVSLKKKEEGEILILLKILPNNCQYEHSYQDLSDK